MELVVTQCVSMWLRYRLMELRGRDLYAGHADEHQCVFIHIPKAAGTSVAQSLFGTASRHVRWSTYHLANRRKFARYYKFTFVRNPWDRLLSAYFFLKRGGINSVDAEWAKRNLCDFDDFDQFVKEWVTEENVWRWVHFLPQHYWICDEHLACMMDFVGRTETIAADFRTVADKLGVRSNLAVTNRTRSDHYSRYYTDEARDIVAHVYAEDIRLFNYRFESEAAAAAGRQA